MATPTSSDDTASWFQIMQQRFGDPLYWPMIDTAGQLADRTAVLVGADMASEAGRGLHSRIALAAFEQLVQRQAALFPPGHELAERPGCKVNRDQFRSWMTGAGTDAANRRVASRLRLDDTLHAGGPNLASRLSRLVDEAQSAGVFGLPGHEIRLWSGGDPDIYGDGFFVTIQPPTGPMLVHGPMSDQALLGRDATGVQAATNALTHIGRCVNTVLAEQWAHLRAVHTGAVAAPGPPNHSAAPRAFGAPITGATIQPPSGRGNPDPAPARQPGPRR